MICGLYCIGRLLLFNFIIVLLKWYIDVVLWMYYVGKWGILS